MNSNVSKHPKSPKEFLSVNFSLKWLGLVFSVIFLAYINEAFMRQHYPFYDRQLRDLSHLLAGIVMPHFFEILFYTINDYVRSAKIYILASLILELWGIRLHGYFQWDQYLCDLLGTGVFLIFAYLINKSTNRIKIKEVRR